MAGGETPFLKQMETCDIWGCVSSNVIKDDVYATSELVFDFCCSKFKRQHMTIKEVQHKGRGVEVGRPVSLIVIVQRPRGRPSVLEGMDVVVDNNFFVGIASPSGSLDVAVVKQCRLMLYI